MKKNKMMRNTAALGVAVLLTASVLSGTLAKYTTTAEGTDSARVAKWGIVMNSTGVPHLKILMIPVSQQVKQAKRLLHREPADQQYML